MYGDGRTRRRHSTDRGRRTDPRARDAYFGCVADVPTAADDLRGMPIEPDAGPSRFGCPGPVQADRRARFADGFGGVSRDMRRAPSSVGPVTAPVASPLAPFERPGMSSSSRTGRDHQAELVDARRAYVEAMDRLSERQRAYQVEREERIRQMDAQANLVMAPLREAAADAEDKMRAAARSLQRSLTVGSSSWRPIARSRAKSAPCSGLRWSAHVRSPSIPTMPMNGASARPRRRPACSPWWTRCWADSWAAAVPARRL